MGYGIQVEVWGEYALFSRPEMKTERVSYDCMTPSAARGLLDAIYWHPGMRWKIDRIYVLNPIRTTNIRRNEVSSKVSARNVNTVRTGGQAELFINVSADIQQRASLLLRNVHYIIEAHFEMTGNGAPSDTPEKFYNIVLRRLKKGQCYHQPCFGCREFPANFCLYEGTIPKIMHADANRNLGFMLYDLDYENPDGIQPMFFQAKLEDGILDVRDCEVYR